MLKSLLLHGTVPWAPEAVGAVSLYGGRTMCAASISFQFRVLFGSPEPALLGVFAPWELVSAAVPSSLPKGQLLSIDQCATGAGRQVLGWRSAWARGYRGGCQPQGVWKGFTDQNMPSGTLEHE